MNQERQNELVAEFIACWDGEDQDNRCSAISSIFKRDAEAAKQAGRSTRREPPCSQGGSHYPCEHPYPTPDAEIVMETLCALGPKPAPTPASGDKVQGARIPTPLPSVGPIPAIHPAADDLAKECAGVWHGKIPSAYEQAYYGDAGHQYKWDRLAAHVRSLLDDAVKEAKAEWSGNACNKEKHHLGVSLAVVELELDDFRRTIRNIQKSIRGENGALPDCHAKELKAARRTALVDMCRISCPSCKIAMPPQDSEFWEKTTDWQNDLYIFVTDKHGPCFPCRRLIAALDQGSVT